MKKAYVSLMTLVIICLIASSAISMSLRSPDQINKGASEISLDMQLLPIQDGVPHGRNWVGIGYEYGVTDRFGLKSILTRMSATNGTSSTQLELGGSYALLLDSPQSYGVSLQGSITKHLGESSGTLSDDLVLVESRVVTGKRIGRFYPFIGLGIHTYSSSRAHTNLFFYDANLSTKYDFSQRIDGVINYDYTFNRQSGGPADSSVTGYLAYDL